MALSGLHWMRASTSGVRVSGKVAGEVASHPNAWRKEAHAH